eukprot:4665845-Amphidinium_carterae.2
MKREQNAHGSRKKLLLVVQVWAPRSEAFDRPEESAWLPCRESCPMPTLWLAQWMSETSAELSRKACHCFFCLFSKLKGTEATPPNGNPLLSVERNGTVAWHTDHRLIVRIVPCARLPPECQVPLPPKGTQAVPMIVKHMKDAARGVNGKKYSIDLNNFGWGWQLVSNIVGWLLGFRSGLHDILHIPTWLWERMCPTRLLVIVQYYCLTGDRSHYIPDTCCMQSCRAYL